MTYIPEALRELIKSQAELRCQYCLLHEENSYFPHEIDHIYAEKHGGETMGINLCLACADCNLYKGSDLCSLDPITKAIVALFHPKRDRWTEHFKLESNGFIEPLSAKGRVTVRLLRMNNSENLSERARLISLDEF